jgi:inorganic pyrophosphatase
VFRLHDIESRDRRSKRINVIIDTPKGSRTKCKYDEALGLFRLSRVLPAGMQFPYDFGSVPRTRAEDGDALDVLVLMDAATFPGCLVTVQLLGVLRATQRDGRRMARNDRLIAGAVTPVNRPAYKSIGDLGKDRLNEIEHFFVSYNLAQGREFTPTGRAGPRAAEKVLREAMRAFALGSGQRSSNR